MGDGIVVSNLIMNIVSRGSAKAGKSLRETASSMRGLSKASSTATKHTNQLFNSLKRIAMYRILRTIIKEIGKAFSEGLKNAYAFSQTVNGKLAKALDSIASSGMQMKNQLGAALGELIMNLQPMIEALANLITRVADAFSRLFAVLGGRSTYNKATASTEKWADAAGGAAKAAKEWKKQLLGFDEINKLEAPNDSSGGGKAPDSIGNWEEAPAMMEWARQLREITMDWFNNLNLEPLINAWERLKQAVGGFVSLVNDALYWAYTKVLLPLAGWTIEKGLPATLVAVAEAFELITTVLDKLSPLFAEFFEMIIKPFGQFVGDTFVKIMEDLAETFESLREKVEQANSLGEFIESLDGKEKIIVAIATAILAVSAAIATLKIVKGVVDGVTTAFKLLTSPVGLAVLAVAALVLVGIELYQRFEFVRDIVDSVTEKFKGFWENLKTYLTEFEGLSFGETVEKIFTDLATAIEDVNWVNVGIAIYNVISGAFSWMIEELQNAFGNGDIDFSSVVSSFFEFLGSAFGAAYGLLTGIAAAIGTELVNALKTVFDTDGDGETSLKEIGESIVNGIYKGIDFVLKKFGGWVVDNVLKPFIDGFKKAFGISEESSSEQMKPLGKSIWEGIQDGIKSIVDGVAEWLETKVWEPFKKAIKSIFGIKTDGGAAENTKTFGESVIEGLKAGIEKAWTGIGTWFQSTVWTPLQTEFENLLSAVSSWAASIQSVWASIQQTADRIYQQNVDVEGLYSVYPGQYKADGGFVDEGELFVAREHGAELVGSIGNRTAVANNDQIVAAVSSGVAQAVSSVMGSGNRNNRNIVINVNGKEFVRAIYSDMQSVTREKGFSLVNA